MDIKDFKVLVQEGQQSNNSQLEITYSQINQKIRDYRLQELSSVMPTTNHVEESDHIIIIQSVIDEQKNSVLAHSLCQRSRNPVLIICPACKLEGYTRIQYEMGYGSWCLVQLLLCFFWFFVCIPCFYKGCKDAKHYCQSCKQLIDISQFKICSDSKQID